MMKMKGIVVVILLLPALALASSSSSSGPLAQPTPESLAGLGCSNEVVSFSPCLNYVSSSPNNRSSQPSLQCCRIFSSVFQKHEAACLCYLARRPLIHSFRINTTRLYSLSSLCQPEDDENVGSDSKISLESLCSGTAGTRHHRHPHPSSPPLPSSSPLPKLESPESVAPSSSSGSTTEALKSSIMETLIILISLLLGEFFIPSCRWQH